MKTKIMLLILFAALIIIPAAYSDIPHLLNYQGKATDSGGAPLNGAYDITFRIYDHATAGELKWSEIHQDVSIENGIFQVLLGSVTPLDLAFDEDYWIAIEIGTDGEMTPRTRLASVGYAYTAENAEHAEHAETASVVGVPFYISGLEVEHVDPKHIKVTPGAVDIDGKVLQAIDYSSIIDIEGSSYIAGCDSPNPWIYVYLYNNNDEIAYILADKAPDKADYQGNTNGIKKYYIAGDIAYRCIGAVRTNDGTKNGNLLIFFQQGNLIMWDIPINITTSPSVGWRWSSATPCSAAIPSISMQGIFGMMAKGNQTNVFCAVKPNGSNWSCNLSNAISVYASFSGASNPSQGVSGQQISLTDSKQRVQYVLYATSVALDVEGYAMNIR